MTRIDKRHVNQELAARPKVSAFVDASAGSGKTLVLSDRVLRLLLEGADPWKILCLTYTKAAAAEMSNRIHKTLADWVGMNDARLRAFLTAMTHERPDDERMTLARRLFAKVIDAKAPIRIQTIHAFCESVLRRFPIEAGIPPHFDVIDEQTSRDLLKDARVSVLVRARSENNTDLGDALKTVVKRIGGDAFDELVAAVLRDRDRFRRLELHASNADKLHKLLREGLGLDTAATEDGLRLNACQDDVFNGSALRDAADLVATGSKTDRARAATIHDWLAASTQDRADGLNDYIGAFLTNEGAIRSRLATKACSAAIPVLETEARRMLSVRGRLADLVLADGSAAVAVLAEAITGEYKTLKQAGQHLDFDDLIGMTLDLLTKRSTAAWVLFKLDGGIDHVLIDEAQDTSPAQWKLV
ncbi:MAG: UvrD-helicase domain-containing protein, partial [Pseudomonadota bacterium]|nr:UvrD-helicase domain-containing protein [Pseudomonadota bacterium]